jgi:hypothetical protein
MHASLHRVMTTLVVGLMIVARASGPGTTLTLTLTRSRPGRAPLDLHRRNDLTTDA